MMIMKNRIHINTNSNGSSVKITNLEGKVSAGFEFWINDATSDFYIQGNTDHRAELATGKT